MKIAEVGQGGLNVDPVEASRGEYGSLIQPAQVTRTRETLPKGSFLDMLLDERGGDTMLVVLHGATDRGKYQMPRFEWMSTINEISKWSTLYVSDPVLSVDDVIQLAWYVGWGDLDLHEVIADRVQEIANAMGYSTLVFCGSSGGGFAALQISRLIPGSYALAMNAQTAIDAYLVNGSGLGPQRTFIERLMPELMPAGGLTYENQHHWADPRRSRLSAVAAYSQVTNNRVFLVQNVNDFHYEEHFVPFTKSFLSANDRSSLRAFLYAGPGAHVVPSREIFQESVLRCLEWSSSES